MGHHPARLAPPQFSALLQRTAYLCHRHLDADRSPGVARLPRDGICPVARLCRLWQADSHLSYFALRIVPPPPTESPATVDLHPALCLDTRARLSHRHLD